MNPNVQTIIASKEEMKDYSHFDRTKQLYSRVSSRFIFMESYIKKIVLLLLAVFVLVIVIFWGTNYFKNQQASLAGIITAQVTINPLKISVSSPKGIKVDRVFLIKAIVENKGETKIEKMKVEIFLPDELELIREDKEQEIEVLAPKRKKFVFWSVKGKKVGNYIISVKALGELNGELISVQDSIMVIIKKSGRWDWPQEWFQSFLDFFRKNFSY